MTDNEIIKALECCSKLNYSDNWDICKKECPYAQNCYDEANGVHFLKDLIAFINRQKAEIERLKRLLEQEEKATNSLAKKCYKDGVKEFAERLKETAVTSITVGESTYYCVGLHHFDNLVKEFTEGKDNGK